jgi:tetratricopeptide (TPR) repeat protein
MNWNLERSRVFCCLAILCLSLALGGCGGKEEKKAKHWSRAKQYIEKNELNKAVIELRNVTQLDPKDDAAHYELGEIYLKLKQGREAFQSYSRAAAANPENLPAQLKIGQIYLLGKQAAEARKKAELILEKTPNNIEALMLLSGVQVQERDVAGGIATMEKAVQLDQKHFGARLSLCRLYVLKGDLGRAESEYQKVKELDPKSRTPYVELSSLYARAGRWDKAEAELKGLMTALGEDGEGLTLLARFYESRENWPEAEKNYLKAVAVSPKEDVGALMNLAGFHARRKSYEQALDAVRKAAEVRKDDLDILTAMAQLQFDFQKLQEAEASVDRVLGKDKGHPGANFLKGRMYLAKRDFGKSLEHLDLVVKERPNDALVHHFRGLALLGKGERKMAEQDLLKAVELNPWMLESRVILGELFLRDRNLDLARQQIEPALKQAPKNLKVLSLQGTLKILERDAKGAEAVFQEIVSLYPDNAEGQVQLGVIYRATNRGKEALKRFERALELDPFQTDALSLLVDSYVREKQFEKALAACRANKQKVGERPRSVAAVAYLEGSIFLAMKETAKARAHFEQAIEADPNLLAPYASLASLYQSENRLSEAKAQYEAALKRRPDYLQGYMALGTLYDQAGDGEKAEGYYRKALEIKKDFGPAANNLAWNLAERGKNIDEALSYAQLAKEQMPKSAAVMDTLGWIYTLKGVYGSAIAELQDALALAPEVPEINFHLGLAYYKSNQPKEARRYLAKALNLSGGFKGAVEARKVLESIDQTLRAK